MIQQLCGGQQQWWSDNNKERALQESEEARAARQTRRKPGKRACCRVLPSGLTSCSNAPPTTKHNGAHSSSPLLGVVQPRARGMYCRGGTSRAPPTPDAPLSESRQYRSFSRADEEASCRCCAGRPGPSRVMREASESRNLLLLLVGGMRVSQLLPACCCGLAAWLAASAHHPVDAYRRRQTHALRLRGGGGSLLLAAAVAGQLRLVAVAVVALPECVCVCARVCRSETERVM